MNKASKKIYFYLLILFSLASACTTYTIRVKDGLTAYELKQYAKAVPLLEESYKKEKDTKKKASIAAAIAQSLEKSNQHQGAPDWWQKAKDLHSTDQYWEGLIESLIFNGRTDEAKALLTEAIDVIGPAWVRKKSNNLKLTEKWLAEPEKSGFTISEMEGINSSQADFAPSIYQNKLLFSSDRKEATGGASYDWTNEAFMDIFAFDRTSKAVKPFADFALNTEGNEGFLTYTADSSRAFFVLCQANEKTDAHTCQIYSSDRNEDGWEEPLMLPFQDVKYNYTMPQPGNARGSMLFFASDDANGWGGLDIYWAEEKRDGWAEPRILPRRINTEGDEGFPFVEKDTLYFSSNGLGGMGGFDIYKSYLVKGKWQPAMNLRAPLNSVADDMSFVIDFKNSTYTPYLQKGFFVSNRIGGQGKDDIYTFERVPAIIDTPIVDEPEPPIVDNKPTKPVDEQTINTKPITEKARAYLDIKVMDEQGKAIPDASISFRQGTTDTSLQTNREGMTSHPIDINQFVTLNAQKRGFLSSSTNFRTDTIKLQKVDKRFIVEMRLKEIAIDKEFVLENIYYDFDKWDIRQDAEASLDQLISILNQNPSVSIRLNSYTDCRGQDRYNQILSQKRANSAVDYLINGGINADRLKARGYGELSPIADCRCVDCLEEEHQLNRRTSFTILDF